MTDTIALSIKKQHYFTHKRLVDTKPQGLSVSDYNFQILELHFQNQDFGILDFNQSLQMWENYLSKCTEPQYKSFYERLNSLNILEKRKTIQRMIL